MTNAELHLWLAKELPARTAEIQGTFNTMHRLMPKAFKDWPTDAEAALKSLEAEGLLENVLGEWRWVGKAQRVERCLF